ncbi:DUF4174 domain-containing protein [Aliagarivorans marinus]|uniref:DUF4174 domain-containing protein n=1 Tax=Aliagarivorans marinus TaxID=561965 RepID=UPI0003F7E837|nr:DUF4174 domain-containing protein [Aliagarivorans marinus]
MTHLKSCLVSASVMLASFSGASYADEPLSSLKQLIWQNRVIVVLASPSYEQELQQLYEQQSAIEERHVLWFIAAPERVSNYRGQVSDAFWQELQSSLASYTEGVLLIGKDGGLKRYDERLELTGIFAEIDGMPMRQFEMFQQESK